MDETVETPEEFFQNCQREFGSKILITTLENLLEDQIRAINEHKSSHLTLEDFKKYPEQAWLIENNCPVCGVALLGLFGSFKWGIQHGVGSCSNCNKVDLRFYHYVGEEKIRICAFSIVGF